MSDIRHLTPDIFLEMFRNRERATRILVIFVSIMVILSLVIPFIQALRG